MQQVTALLKRHALVSGIALMFLLTWPIELANAGVLPFEVPFIVAYLVGYGIVIATLIMTGLTLGKAGVVALLKRYLIWRVGWRWYLAPFALVPAIYLVTLALNAWISQTPIDFSRVLAYDIFGADAKLWLLIIPFLITDALTNGEEIGWRGYVLPRLQAKQSALAASLILGVIWGLWHLPKFISHWDTALFGWFLVEKLAVTVFYTWLYNNTKGSLLLVTLFHAACNTAAVFLPLANTVTSNLSEQIIAAVVWSAVAVVVVIMAAPARLSRAAPKQTQVEPQIQAPPPGAKAKASGLATT
jgi:membrane protease YdiL (CAAX protease family)